MIKYIFIAVAAACCVYLAYVSPLDTHGSQEDYQTRFDEVVYHHASRLWNETTVEGLEYRATNVVRGRVLNDSRMVFQFNDVFHPDRITTGNNAVSLEIVEVFKGNLNVGDVITILELYYIVDRTLFTDSNYMPSMPYQEYFFFLSEQLTNYGRSEEAHFCEGLLNGFWVLHGERGRFLIPSNRVNMVQNYSLSDLSLGTVGDSDLYMRLWQEVIDTYMNWRLPPVPRDRFRQDALRTQDIAN